MKKNDVLLIGAVLALALLSFGVWRLFFHGAGAAAVVTGDGVEIARLPLAIDDQLLVTDADGGTNLVVIEDGKAFVQEADCPDAVCIRTGKISMEGQTVVCLPHKLIVTIEGEE